ncbi:helix-turn-helix domain-containing protein [Paenibacillus sp. 1P07SE]|uniref:helix-turn-helix domain-containing protein n=1 Tax=Paenibacillus sp. 1P07SE TaxID=3132209 RepID=UPI0039A704AD
MTLTVRIPIYVQYLVSYAIMLFIPLLITGMLVYNKVVDTVTEQALLANESILNQAGDLVDTKFFEMANIAADLSWNPLISLTQFRDDFYYFSTRNAMNYNLTNSFLHDVLLYDRHERLFYSSESTYSLDLFSKVYAYKEWPLSLLEETLHTLDRPMLRAAEPVNNGSYVTYLRPIPVQSYNPRGTALFLIREDVLKDILQSAMQFDGNEVFIIDTNGKVVTGIFQREEDAYFFPLELQTAESDRGTIQWNRPSGSTYLSYLRSKDSGFTYVILTPERELLLDVIEIKNSTLASLILILLVGGFMIYLSMQFNYNPIRRLIATVEQTWGHIKGSNGFHRIESALSAARAADLQLQSSAPFIRDSLLLSLLQGKFTDAQQFNAKGEAAGMHLEGDDVLVAVVQSANAEELPADRSQAYAPFALRGLHVLDLMTESGLTLILTSQRQEEIPVKEFASLLEWLSSRSGNPITIGVGTRCSELRAVTQSYLEASTAAQHQFIYGSGCVIYFHELDPALSRISWNSKDAIQHFLHLLERGSADEAMEAADHLLLCIREKSHSLFQAKSICLETMNSALLYLRERRAPNSSPADVSDPDILSFANFHSIERLLRATADVCHAACLAAGQSPPSLPSSTIGRIRDYIAEHYESYHFSLQSAAEQLGLSAPYVSRLFKEETGETVMEYVNRLRIEKAKELLRTTDLPVKEIVERIGYKDVSNFIRKFKHSVRLTPIEYRTYCRSKS